MEKIKLTPEEKKQNLHVNSANVKCYYVIGILFDKNEVRFVTELNWNPKEALWEKGKEPMRFDSKQYAEDIAFGLLVNGYPAIVMDVPDALINVKNNEEYL